MKARQLSAGSDLKRAFVTCTPGYSPRSAPSMLRTVYQRGLVGLRGSNARQFLQGLGETHGIRSAQNQCGRKTGQNYSVGRTR